MEMMPKGQAILIQGILTIVEIGEISKEEVEVYVKQIKEKNEPLKISFINIKVDNGYVDVKYRVDAPPFERIRRVTGYLVGDLGKWNDAKRAEERDRVKHG